MAKINTTASRTILKVITTVASAVYAGWFLLSLIAARRGTPSIVSIDWNVSESPQFIISILLVTATAALWILREKGQAFSAFLSSAAIGYSVYHWSQATAQIKANTGVPGNSLLSNTLIGASWFDVFALVAFLSLVGFVGVSLAVIRLHRKHHFGLKPSPHP